MKKIIALLIIGSVIILNASTPAFAQKALTPKQKARIQKRIEKLSPAERREFIRSLNAKKQRLNKKLRSARKKKVKNYLEGEIVRVERELKFLLTMQAVVPLKTGARPPHKLSQLPTKPIQQKNQKVKAYKRRRIIPKSPQYGISAGYIAGIPGIMGELRFFEPFDLTATSLRAGAAYAQGNDANGDMRKHAVLVFDGIYRLNPPHTRGIRSYFGFGANYDVYTTGRVSGGLGYGTFYGVEGGGYSGGQIFFEIGYGTIRTGFSPDYTGLTTLVGYKF
jgi:hypothetical protein